MESHVVILIVVGVLGFWWYLGMRARELALNLALAACMKAKAKLKDDSVLLTSQKPLWKGAQHGVRIRRIYEFHLIDGGGQQHAGWIVLEGDTLESMMIDGRSTSVLHEDHEGGWTEDMGDTRGFGSNKCGGFKIASSGCGAPMMPGGAGCGPKGCDAPGPAVKHEAGDG